MGAFDLNRLLAIAEKFQKDGDTEGTRKLQSFLDARSVLALAHRQLNAHLIEREHLPGISEAQRTDMRRFLVSGKGQAHEN